MVVVKGASFEQITPEDVFGSNTQMGHLKLDSTIWPAPLWEIKAFRDNIRVAKLVASKELLSRMGPINLTARNLMGVDVGLSTRHWHEQTSGTVNAWENSVVSANSVPDNTVLGIVGCVDLGTQGSVSAIRLEVGGLRAREWDLQAGFNPNITGGGYVDLTRIYIASSPLTVAPLAEVTITMYPRGATNTDALPANVVILGIVIEQEGGSSGLTSGSPSQA